MKNFLYILLAISFLFGGGLISPIPLSVSYDKDKALLGRKLFYDTKLSKDNTISCVTCHNLSSGGDDGLSVSFGVSGQKGSVNSPTLFNAVFNMAQFWDGRAKDLKEQAKYPITNPVEMVENFENVIKKLKKDKFYIKTFNKIYKDGITEDNIADAIAEFEKTLITPDSKFDRYLKGDKKALNKDELAGYKLFKSYGCISCHNGVNMGGNLYQKFGIFIDRFDDIYLGRYNVTKDIDDKYVVKVPTLRNIAQTAPYFHNGSVKTLDEAVKTMFIAQLGINPNKDDIKKIVLFLKTLDGKIPNIIRDND